MIKFLFNVFLWTFAFYGMIEIIKLVIHMYIRPNFSSNGIYLIVAVKNEENKIEGFIRSFLFRLLYGKEDSINNIYLVDLNSNDKTSDILNILSKDYDCLKYTDLKTCKQIFENINKI